MQHSLEAYFLVNLAVDAALIAVVSRANECMRLRRVCYGSLLAASYALATETVSARLAHPAIQLLLLAVLGLILCGEPDVQKWCSVSIQLAGGATMLGGTSALLPSPERFPVAAIGAGLVLICAILNVRNHRMFTWEVTVLIALRGCSVSFRALIDTGNRLHEPVSGLPVLIAESALLHDLPIAEMPSRRISFGALGGSGSVKCFHPDAVLIRRGDKFFRAPDVWVAIYPGRIPGAMRALAPPSFAVIPGKS